jgi:hypothetical protein
MSFLSKQDMFASQHNKGKLGDTQWKWWKRIHKEFEVAMVHNFMKRIPIGILTQNQHLMSQVMWESSQTLERQ